MPVQVLVVVTTHNSIISTARSWRPSRKKTFPRFVLFQKNGFYSDSFIWDYLTRLTLIGTHFNTPPEGGVLRHCVATRFIWGVCVTCVVCTYLGIVTDWYTSSDSLYNCHHHFGMNIPRASLLKWHIKRWTDYIRTSSTYVHVYVSTYMHLNINQDLYISSQTQSTYTVIFKQTGC